MVQAGPENTLSPLLGQKWGAHGSFGMMTYQLNILPKDDGKASKKQY